MCHKLCFRQSYVGRVLCFSAVVGVTSFGVLISNAHGQLFTAPDGGWAYSYEGDTAATPDNAALDGTWNHDNGSDQWDGTGPGVGTPGGAGVFTEASDTFLRIQDTGNPSDYALPDPSNRKVYLTHDLTADGATNSVLDDGVTMSFRARISTGGTLADQYPSGGAGTAPWPAGGDGGTISNSGKGMIGIRQGKGGLISFDLALQSDTPETGPNGGLVMNQLNGNSISAAVDNGDGGTPNFEPLADPTTFREFWVVISKVKLAEGTHRVRLWMDGNEQDKSIFDVTAGSGGDGSFGTYLGLGRVATGEIGSIDLDFVSVKPGIYIPGGAVEGDVNGDGDVDLDDFELIRTNFLQPVLTREQGDLNYDGVVDLNDFGGFKDAFVAGGGNLTSLSWVPEPSTAALFVLAVVVYSLRQPFGRSFPV